MRLAMYVLSFHDTQTSLAGLVYCDATLSRRSSQMIVQVGGKCSSPSLAQWSMGNFYWKQELLGLQSDFCYLFAGYSCHSGSIYIIGKSANTATPHVFSLGTLLVHCYSLLPLTFLFHKDLSPTKQ